MLVDLQLLFWATESFLKWVPSYEMKPHPLKDCETTGSWLPLDLNPALFRTLQEQWVGPERLALACVATCGLGRGQQERVGVEGGSSDVVVTSQIKMDAGWRTEEHLGFFILFYFICVFINTKYSVCLDYCSSWSSDSEMFQTHEQLVKLGRDVFPSLLSFSALFSSFCCCCSLIPILD